MLDPSASTSLPAHVHHRDWRPCPATRPAPIVPTRAYARWLWLWSVAILHQETRAAFLSTVGADSVTFGSPFDVTMRDGPDRRECLCGGDVDDHRNSPGSITETPHADEPPTGRTSLAA